MLTKKQAIYSTLAVIVGYTIISHLIELNNFCNVYRELFNCPNMSMARIVLNVLL